MRGCTDDELNSVTFVPGDGITIRDSNKCTVENNEWVTHPTSTYRAPHVDNKNPAYSSKFDTTSTNKQCEATCKADSSCMAWDRRSYKSGTVERSLCSLFKQRPTVSVATKSAVMGFRKLV